MSEEITITYPKIDVGNEYWNDRIREMQDYHKPIMLWITKEVIKEMNKVEQ